MVALGLGLSVNNAVAVVEALSGPTGEFRRTPKYGVRARGDRIAAGGRRRGVRVQPLVEIAFGTYFTLGVVYALAAGVYGAVPFLALFQIGFLYTGFASRAPATRRACPGAARAMEVRRDAARGGPGPQGGLEGVVATSSAICHIDGERACWRTPVTTSTSLPARPASRRPATSSGTAASLAGGAGRPAIGSRRGPPAPRGGIAAHAQSAARNAMDALRTLVSALAHSDPDVDDRSPAAAYRTAVRLTAQVGSVVAAWGRLNAGGGVIEPDPALGHAANFLLLLTVGVRPGWRRARWTSRSSCMRITS